MDIDVEKETEMEIIWCKIINDKTNIYIGAYYGKQENGKRETIVREYSILNTQILRLQQDGHILTGDFNSIIEIETHNQIIQC